MPKLKKIRIFKTDDEEEEKKKNKPKIPEHEKFFGRDKYTGDKTCCYDSAAEWGMWTFTVRNWPTGKIIAAFAAFYSVLAAYFIAIWFIYGAIRSFPTGQSSFSDQPSSAWINLGIVSLHHTTSFIDCQEILPRTGVWAALSTDNAKFQYYETAECCNLPCSNERSQKHRRISRFEVLII